MRIPSICFCGAKICREKLYIRKNVIIQSSPAEGGGDILCIVKNALLMVD